MQKPKKTRVVTGHRSAYFILFVALALSTFLRFHAIYTKDGLAHDEVISYLAATGHQAAYGHAIRGDSALTGRWTEAREWKRLVQSDEFFIFLRIRSDLATHDIHPPLYFWLLHIWLWIFGAADWSGPSLNVVISIVTIFAIFSLARIATTDSRDAAGVALVWSLSPVVLEFGDVARQYHLLALFTVLILLLLLKLLDSHGHFNRTSFFLLALIVAAGMLTHYHFILVLTGCCIIVFARIRSRPTQVKLIALSIFIGLILFWIAHPDFLNSFENQSMQLQEYTASSFIYRVRRSIETITGILSYTPVSMKYAVNIPESMFGISFGNWSLIRLILYFVLLASLAVVVGLLTLTPFGRNAVKQWVATQNQAIISIVFLLVWTTSTVIALYLTFQSPVHAMSPKYLAMAWPLFAFLPLILFRVFPRLAYPLTIVFSLVFLLPNAVGDTIVRHYFLPQLPSALQNTHTLVADNLARGVWPRVLLELSDDTRVYVDTQERLLAAPEDWVDSMMPGDILLSTVAYRSTAQGSNALQKLLEERHHIFQTDITQWKWPTTRMFQIEKPIRD